MRCRKKVAPSVPPGHMGKEEEKAAAVDLKSEEENGNAATGQIEPWAASAEVVDSVTSGMKLATASLATSAKSSDVDASLRVWCAACANWWLLLDACSKSSPEAAGASRATSVDRRRTRPTQASRPSTQFCPTPGGCCRAR